MSKEERLLLDCWISMDVYVDEFERLVWFRPAQSFVEKLQKVLRERDLIDEKGEVK